MKRSRKGFYGTAKIIGDTANYSTDLERIAGREPLEANGATAFDSPVRITVVSYCSRERDADGTSAKAAIDGLVHARIIKDDGPKFVTEVLHKQVKVKKKHQEKTEILIESVGVTL